MIPETYNIKKESIVNICKACDWLCTGFRLALLESDFDRAVALHATGNINRKFIYCQTSATPNQIIINFYVFVFFLLCQL
jgi:hypothetical protein